MTRNSLHSCLCLIISYCLLAASIFGANLLGTPVLQAQVPDSGATAKPTASAAGVSASSPRATANSSQDGTAYVGFASNPVSFLFGVVKLETEIGLPGGFALEPELSLLTEGKRFWSPDYDSKGSRYGLVMRKYFSNNGMYDDFYGFLYARASNLSFRQDEEVVDSDLYDYRLKRVTLGFGIGYSETYSSGFTYGLAIGVGRNIVDETESIDSRPLPVVAGRGSSDYFGDAEYGQDFPINVYGRVSIGFRLFSSGYADRLNAAARARQKELERDKEYYLKLREQRLNGTL